MKYERTKALKMIPQIDYKVAIKTSFKLLLFQIYKKMKILQFVYDYKDSCSVNVIAITISLKMISLNKIV